MKKILLLGLIQVLFQLKLFPQAEIWSPISSYGMTDYEIIMRTNDSGGNFIRVHRFLRDNPGKFYNSESLLKASNGKYYGTAPDGGDSFGAVLFEYDYFSNSYKALYHFNPKGQIIFGPTFGLIETSSGVLFGKTADGSIYKFDIATRTIKYYPIPSSTIFGSSSTGPPCWTGDSMFYCLNNSGGKNAAGVLYSFNINTEQYRLLYEFSSSLGGSPVFGLQYHSNGNLYGSTSTGGVGMGTIFSYNPKTSTYVKLYDLKGTQGNIKTPLYLYNDSLYLFGSSGTYNTISDFNIRSNKSNIRTTALKTVLKTMLVTSDKKVLGFNSSGKYNKGEILEFDPSNNTLITKYNVIKSTTSLYSFHEITKDSFIGIGTPTTNDYYTSSPGVFLFLRNLDSLEFRLDLNLALQGINPSGRLVKVRNKIYGFTKLGGVYNFGGIFEIDPNTRKYLFLHSFRTNSIMDPNSKGFCSNDSLLIFIGTGGIYKFNLNTNSLSGLISRQTACAGTLLKTFNGKYYGWHNKGLGGIFEYDPVADTAIWLYTHTVASLGGSPVGELTEGLDGKIYGVTKTGGANSKGGIFSFDPKARKYDLIYSFDGTAGFSEPVGSIFERSAGLFVLADFNSINPAGSSCYEYNLKSNQLTRLFYLNAASTDGIRLLSNGNMVYLTKSGGKYGFGALIIYDYKKQLRSEVLSLNTRSGTGVSPGFYKETPSEICFTPQLDSIVGDNDVCGDSSVVQYSVNQKSWVKSYFWTLPSGAQIIGKADTNVINVRFTQQSESGYLYVQAVNECRGPVSKLYVKINPSVIKWKNLVKDQVLLIGKQFPISMGDFNAICHKGLEFSSDSGRSYSIIKSPLNSADSVFDWKVPDAESNNCFIRISGYNNGKIWISPRFSIVSPVPYKAVDFLGEYNTIKVNPINPENATQPGYPLRFKLQIKNDQAINLLTLKGSLESVDTNILITDRSGTFNNILAGKKGWSVDEFEIYIKPNCPNNHILKFDLRITDEIDAEDPWTSRLKFQFPVNVLDIPAIVIDDDNIPDSDGDDDDVVEKTEVIEILPLLRNKSVWQYAKPTGWLTTPDYYVNIWSNKVGATGTVLNTWRYNAPGGVHGDLSPLANNVTPEQDYVFDYLADATYSLDFRMLLDCYLTDFKVENPGNGGGFTEPKIRYGLPYGLNKGFPKPINVDITDPSDGSIFPTGTIIPLKATITSAVGLDSVSLFVNDSLNFVDNKPVLVYNWNTSGLSSGTYQIKVIAKDVNSNEADDFITVVLDKSSNVKQQPEITDNPNISIFPNPTSGVFEIYTDYKFVDSKLTCILTSTLGTELMRIKLTGPFTMVSAVDLPPGIYQLSVYNSEKCLGVKFVVITEQ